MRQIVCRAFLINWFSLGPIEPSTVLGNTGNPFRLELYLFFCSLISASSVYALLKKCKLPYFLSTDNQTTNSGLDFRLISHCVVQNYILLLKRKKTTGEFFKKLFSHVIIVQYYNVLCAKFHLKIIYKRKYNTVCAEGSRCITKANKGTKPTSLDDYASLHSTITCFHNYLCYSDERPSFFVHHQTGFTKHKLNLTKHSYNAGGLFGANSFPNSILFNSMKVTLHITWFLPKIIQCC